MTNLAQQFRLETSLRDTLESQRLANDLQLSFELEASNLFLFTSENHFSTFQEELEMRNLEFETL